MNINYEGLVCYLNSNKNSKQNNVWLDSSGNNNNATLTSFSDNDFNGSYVQFNGNNYAVIPRCIQDDFTLSAEVILESSTSTAEPWQLWYNYASLIDAETVGVRNDFGLTISKDGHAYFGIGNPDRTIPYAQKSLFNEKHIITCTRKKDTGEYAMYIDGILIKKEMHPNKNSLTYPSEIYVGKGINNRFLSMKLFSIRIYNRVLDNFEIKQDSFFVKNKVYVNENNLPIIVDKLTDAKNIKISNNKYGNRVQTVIDKIVEKADDVTKAIKQEVINDSYSFKVGTGDVDVSTDVEDGFGEVGIKGVTYQNILGTRINTSDGVEKSNNIITFNKVAQTNCTAGFLDSLAQVDKTYTLIFDILENTIENPTNGNVGKINIVSYNSGNYFIKYKETGHKKILLKQPATSTGKPYVEFYNSTSGKFVMTTPILLEGNHLDNPSIPSKISNIVGVGDKSKNLFDSGLKLGNISWETGVENNLQQHVMSAEYIKVRPNTKYIIHSNTSHKLNLYFYDNSKVISAPSLEGVAISFTTNSTTEYIKVLSVNNTDLSNSRFQLEEGDVATSYEPYHDGHKIEILSNGKNLFDIQRYLSDNENSQYYKISADGGLEILKLDDRSSFKNLDSGISVKRNTAYSIKCSLPWDSLRVLTQKNNVWSNIKPTNYQFYSGDSDMIYIKFVEKENFPKAITHIQVEESSTPSSYQPYFADKTQILLNEPLMKLPNGVCDEITRDGKLIRRVGKVVLDGSESWKTAINNNKSRFDLSLNSVKTPSTWSDKTVPNMICSNLNVQPFVQIYAQGKSGITFYHANSDRLIVASLGNSCSLVEFKQWLSQNPATVYYELAEPIITELPAPYLRIFKDGHLTFNTLVAPESTHYVQLNKSAQIQSAIKESQWLDNKIDSLENGYDTLMLSTMSILNNLELDYTLK